MSALNSVGLRYFMRMYQKKAVSLEFKSTKSSFGSRNSSTLGVATGNWLAQGRNMQRASSRFPGCCSRWMLPSRTLQRTFQRGFHAKRDKTGIKVENATRNEPQSKPLSPKEKGMSPRSETGRSGLLSFAFKTGVYTIGFSALVFGGSALWQQENIRRHHEEFWNRGLEKRRARKGGEVRGNLNDIWNHLSTVHKVTYGIMGVNLLVYACWKLGSASFMQKWFLLGKFPVKSAVSKIGHHFQTMLLSMFSHKGIIHLYVNMYVLSSFAMAWNHLSHTSLGNSNLNGHERYLAFYLSAGVASSFLSGLVKVLMSVPQPSLGASGAILGLIGYTCEKLPNNMLSIAFIPSWSFSAGSARNFIIAFDAVGLLIGAVTGWRYVFFDHAGHLGGMLFGVWYARYGERLIDKYCQYVMELRKEK